MLSREWTPDKNNATGFECGWRSLGIEEVREEMFWLRELGFRNSWPKHEAEWQLASPCQQPAGVRVGPQPAVILVPPGSCTKVSRYLSTFSIDNPSSSQVPAFSVDFNGKHSSVA
jgi:hypothetical protein